MVAAAELMVLPDYLQHGLDLVLCGTAPGPVSAARGHYYANPGNRFWRTLHEIGLTPRLLSPDEDSLLPSFGIGLTDLVKTRSGLDRDLADGDYDVAALAKKIEIYRPRVIAFDSLNAGRRALGSKVVRGRQTPTFAGAEAFVLPSTSGLACGHWDRTYWDVMARHVRKAT